MGMTKSSATCWTCDIKPENVLLTFYGRVCLADFGVARIAGDQGSVGGTLPYNAPELFSHMYAFTIETDIWAFGITLFCLGAGHLTFDGVSPSEIRARILAGNIAYPTHFSEDLRHVLSQILVPDASNRLSLELLKTQ